MPGLTEGQEPDDGGFDAAFAAANAAVVEGELPIEPAAPAADPAPADPAPADPAPAAPPADPAAPPADPAAPPADPAAAAPAAAPDTPPADPAPTPVPAADDIVRQLAEALKQNQQAPAAPEPPAEQRQEQPIYTADELKILSDYADNWPDVAQAEALKRRAEYHDLMKYVFSEVVAFVSPHIDAVRQITNTLHTGEVKSLVPDYTPNLENEVATWVETQPSYLQSGMKQVMQGGTSEEVADLIGRYRAATGAAPAPAAPAATAPVIPAQAPKAELSKTAKQAAASLAPVSGDRTQVPQGEDPQDFDTAFAKYAATMPKNF